MSNNVIIDAELRGNVVISADYIASNFDSTSFIQKNTMFYDFSVSELISCVSPTAWNNRNDFFGFSAADYPCGFSTSGQLGWWTGSSWVYGGDYYQLNDKVWVKFVTDGSTWYLYGLLDNNYTLETLPPTSRWTLAVSRGNTANPLAGPFRFGNTWASITEYFRGTVDLKKTALYLDGTLAWRAVVGLDSSGSVDISKGTYTDGTYKITINDTHLSFSDLTTGTTVGNKMNLFAYVKEGVSGIQATSLDAPSTQPNLYVSNNYIAGDKLIKPLWSSTNLGYGATHYTTVGSPTVSSDYILSDITSSNYLTITLPSISQSFECIEKVLLPATSTASGTEPCAMSTTSGNYFWSVSPSNGVFNATIYLNSSASYGSAMTFSDTSVWVRLFVTTSITKQYFLEDPTNQYTLDTLPSLDSGLWTDHAGYNNRNNLGVFSGKTIAIGVNNYRSRSYSNWSIDLANTRMICDGTIINLVDSTNTEVFVEESLQFSEDIDRTFWIPKDQRKLLSTVAATETLSDKNNLYLTNALTEDVSSFTFCEGTPAGLQPSQYMKQPESVFLSPDHTTILGVQERPDEIVLKSNTTRTITNSLTANGTAGGASPAAFSSSNEGSYPAYKAFDGDTNSFWNPSSSSNPQDLTYYSPDEVYVTKVTIYQRSNGEKPSAGEIQISSDNSTYTTIATFTGNSSAIKEITCDSTVKGKYIRLHKTANYSGWGGVGEMVMDVIPALTDVSAEGDNTWTYLSDSVIDLKGVSVQPDAIDGSIDSNNSGHLFYNLSSSGSKVVVGTDNDQSAGILNTVYSGYEIVFGDALKSSITSITKTGTRCRVYHGHCGAAGYEASAERYLYIPYSVYDSIEDGPVTAGFSSAATAKVLVDVSETATAEYNSSTDSFSYNQLALDSTTLTYVGDYYVNYSV